jgi:hypothetical protein
MGRIAWVMIGLLVAPGCDHVCNVLCPASGRLEVDVVNDQTGAQICDATVTATNGVHVEQLELVSGGCRYAQGECCRPGTYSVRVERVAFRPKVVPNVEIRVRHTDCCEITEGALVEVRLSPTP